MNLYINKKDSARGRKIVADDMILTKDLPTTAGSKMLDGYMSLFEAEVVSKLRDNGFDICAKANIGEFNIDLLGETSFYGETEENGVLKSACAEAVKAGDAEAAIAVDVNGTPRRAAALNNLVYIKPTYGTVSRFGIIPAACSGECVGVMAEEADLVKKLLCYISGHDDKDGTSLPEDKCAMLKCSAEVNAVKKIAVAKSLVALADDATKAIVEKAVKKAEENGIEVVEIDAEELLLAKAAWNTLMSAELCNNVSRYDGIKYGHRAKEYNDIDELYTNSRTESFGYLTKSTILYGSETLSDDNYMKVYDKALRIRRVLSEYMYKTFEECDAIIAPVCSKTSYMAEEVKADPYIAYEESVFTAPASVTGMPAAVSGGVQIIGAPLSDKSLLDLAAIIK